MENDRADAKRLVIRTAEVRRSAGFWSHGGQDVDRLTDAASR